MTSTDNQQEPNLIFFLDLGTLGKKSERAAQIPPSVPTKAETKLTSPLMTTAVCLRDKQMFTIFTLVIDAGDTLFSITSGCYTYEPVAEECPITTIILLGYANTAQPVQGIISAV